MKDFLRNEVQPGEYFSYWLYEGMALYRFIEELPNGTVRAKKLKGRWGLGPSLRAWCRDINGNYSYRARTPEEMASEQAKIDLKTSILHCFSTRAVKYEGDLSAI